MPTPSIRLTCAATVLGLLAAPALAQSTASQPASSAPSASQPAYSAPAASQPATSSRAAQTAPSAAAGANANATTSATAPVTAGLTVKDNTGASIGQVASVDTDTKTGEKMATIKMGADSFRLPTDRLAVADGAATVNLTQAQIQAQLHPKK